MSSAPTVLHVDDDPALRRLVEEVFADAAPDLAFVTVESMEAAMEELEDIDGPLILLVDRRLPERDVWTFVDEAAASLGVEQVPTFVLSGSENPADVAEAYAEGAAAYLEKPIDADGFFEIARLIDDYAKLVTLPGGR